MRQDEIFFDPRHQVVLEGTLDDLVKDVRRDNVTDIRSGEFKSKRLEGWRVGVGRRDGVGGIGGMTWAGWGDDVGGTEGRRGRDGGTAWAGRRDGVGGTEGRRWWEGGMALAGMVALAGGSCEGEGWCQREYRQ
jgi:hypothetical protein